MPWSPIPKFPDIINSLKSMGYDKTVTIEPLRKAVMMNTGLVRDQSIKQTIRAMETLDFIKPEVFGNINGWRILNNEEKAKPKKLPIEVEEIETDRLVNEISEG